MHCVVTLYGCSPHQNLREAWHWTLSNLLNFWTKSRLNGWKADAPCEYNNSSEIACLNNWQFVLIENKLTQHTRETNKVIKKTNWHYHSTWRHTHNGKDLQNYVHTFFKTSLMLTFLLYFLTLNLAFGQTCLVNAITPQVLQTPCCNTIESS